MTIEKRQLEFADRLRQLREQAGFETGKQFAARLGWLPSKVSRIETAKTVPADTDVIAWLDAVDAAASTASDVRDQLRDLRLATASWRRRVRRGHAPVQRQLARREADAAHIVNVELFVVPGLVQTAEYARAVLVSAAAEMADVLPEPDTDAAVRARIRRQDVLYDPAKQIDILVTETALRYRAWPAAVQRGQLDRLSGLLGLPNVRIGIVPLAARLPVVPLHGYLRLDDQVIVELNHTELAVTDPDEVAVYRRITDLLWTGAAEGEQARTLLGTIASAMVE